MSNADFFLKKALGEDFLESLQKFEIWKPGTKSTLDHEEIRTSLQIVPRAVIALLIKELVPMRIGETKEIKLPVAENAILRVTKHERDVFSGDIEDDNKKATEFKLRSLPGVGLVIMSAFELYDMDNLINSPVGNQEAVSPKPIESPVVSEGTDMKIQRLIDDRLMLHDLIGQVVDKKMMNREAIHQLVLAKLTEAVKMIHEKANAALDNSNHALAAAGHAHGRLDELKEKSRKERPLQKFLSERKKPKEFSIQMAKGETFQCPDCGKEIFSGKGFSGCVCYGDSGKVFLKKTENGVKVRFSKNWDVENIEMLLDVLQKKNR